MPFPPAMGHFGTLWHTFGSFRLAISKFNRAGQFNDTMDDLRPLAPPARRLTDSPSHRLSAFPRSSVNIQRGSLLDCFCNSRVYINGTKSNLNDGLVLFVYADVNPEWSK